MKHFFFVSRWLLLLALLVAGRFAARAQNVGIGTTAPTQTLDVNGQLRVRGLTGPDTRLPVVLPDGTLGVNAPVYGTTAGAPALPTAAAGSVGTGSLPIGVAASGTTSYVVNFYGNTLQVFNVANPAAPALLGTVSTGAGSAPYGVAVSGTTAYVVNYGNSNLQTFNVANPAAPVLLATVATGLDPRAVAVSGTTAYVVNESNNTLQAFNVANPAAPALLGTVGTGGGSVGVAVSGTTAYVVNQVNSTLQTFDVANPAAPVALGTVGTGSTPTGVALSGTTAYVTNFNNTLQAFNVANPAVPVLLGTVPTDTQPRAVAVSGPTTYVVSGNTLRAYSFPGPPRAVAVNADGSLASVPLPGGADFIQNGTTPQAAANFNIGGNGTVGGSVGIGTNTPSQRLEVAGTVYSSSGGFRFPDNTVQTTAAATPNLTGDVTSTGAATTYANVVPATKGGAGSVSGILKANGSGTVSQATAGTDYLTPTGSAAGLSAFPTLNQNTTGNAATATTAGTVTGIVAIANGGTGVAALPTGLLKGAGTGTLTAATAGTDYGPSTAGFTGIVKSTVATGAHTAAVAADFPTLNQNTTGNAATATTAGTVTTNANLTGDITSVGNATTYATNVPNSRGGAGTLTGLLKATGGTVAAAVPGTDYLATDPTTASNGLTKTGNNFALGGTLTGATAISGITAANGLTLTGTAAPLITNTTAAASASNRVLGLQGQYSNAIAGSGAHLSFLEGGGSEVGRIASTQDVGSFLIGLSFSTANGTAGTVNERLRISPAGNVGIGTGSPAQKLDVVGNATVSGNVASTGGVLQGGGVVSNRVGSLGSFTAADAGMYFKPGGVLQLVAAGADRVTVDAGGNVGIGTPTPTAVLDVNGSARLRGLTTAGFVLSDASGNLSSTSATGNSFVNNTTAQQTGANFNIGGAGTVGGLLTANGGATVAGATNVNTTGSAATNLGTGSTAGAVTIGRSGGTVAIPRLTTAGLVTTDASGNLGSATAASLDPTTASNGLTKTGNNFALGGTLTGATTVGLGANNLSFTSTTGTVGIGVATGTAPLHVRGTGNALPAGTGSAQSAGLIGRFQTANNLVLDVGGNSTGGVWLQSTDITNLALKYPLMLNPNGGNVGIGTTAPSAQLHLYNFGATYVPSFQPGGSVASGTAGFGELMFGNGGASKGATIQVIDDNNFGSGLYFNVHNSTGLNNWPTGAQTALTLRPNGFVGVGTISPYTQLANTSSNVIGSDFNGTSTQSVNWLTTTNGYAGAFYSALDAANGNGVAVKVTNANAVALDVSRAATAGAAGTPLLRVNGNGNVSIGNTAPLQKLEVEGGIRATGNGAFTAVGGTNQGAHLQWNRSNGEGETWLINHLGGGGANAGIRFGGITSSTGTAPTEWARFNNAGFFGIGTSTPGVPLDVNIAQGSYVINGQYGYLFTGGAGTNNNTPSVNVSIRASGRIICPEFNAVSDRRLKTVVGRSNRAADLALLNRLRITDYTMRDRVQFGGRAFKKVIAQEVEEVFPQAVQQHAGFVPDVYALATAVLALPGDSLVALTLPAPGLPCAATAGQRLRLMGDHGEVVAALARPAAAGARTLTLRGAPALAGGKVFVFGLEHADVRAVDYEALAMLNISATQELARQVAELQAQNAALRAGRATDQAAAAADHASLLTLQAQMARLLGETRQDETAPAGAQARR